MQPVHASIEREDNGTVHFDEPELPGQDGGPATLFLFERPESDELLISLPVEIGFESATKWEFDFSFWSEQKYCALLVHVEKAGETRESKAFGLVLRPIQQEADKVYERVGRFIIYGMRHRWFKTWRKETITLI